MTDVGGRDTRGSRSGLVRALCVGGIVVALDQLTKQWAMSALAGREPVHVVWTLQWNLARNQGMAFSTGQGLGPVIGLLALVIAGVVLRWVRQQTGVLATVAAGLVVGGALGNVADRLVRDGGWMRGAVIDFVDFQWFPIFNLADAAVNVGGALLLVWLYLNGRQVVGEDD